MHAQIEQGDYINAKVFEAIDYAVHCATLDDAAALLRNAIPKHMMVYRGGSHVALINNNAPRGKRVAIITEQTK